MTISQLTANRIHRWTTKNGGFGGRPAFHALRLLREVVELCVSAGATANQIMAVSKNEVDKAETRGEFFQSSQSINVTEMSMEVADATILLEVFCYHYNIDQDRVTNTKIDVVEQRDYVADQDGVLWRP